MSLPFFQTLPLFILILGILVILHELGHYLTARWFKMSAPEFGIGFPPKLWSIGRTEGWIETQGRRLVVPSKFKWPPGVLPGTYVRYETGTDARGRAVLTSLQVVSEENAAEALASPVQNLDPGTEFTLNALPLGGFVRLSGEDDPNAPNAFASKPAHQRLVVLVAGVTMNFLLALVVMIVMAVWTPPPVGAANTQIVYVAPDSPAAMADLRVGDVIVSLNGQDVRDRYDEMRRLIALNLDQPVTMVVERTGRGGIETLTTQVTPRRNPPPSQGALGIGLNRQIGVQIWGVRPGSLADQLGLRPGDALVSVGNDLPLIAPGTTSLLSTGLRDEKAIAEYVSARQGVTYVLPVTYIRNGVLQKPVNLRIPADLPADQADLGLSLRPNALQATGLALAQMYEAIASLPHVLGALVQRGPESGGFVGPVGIVRLTGEIAGRGGLWGVLNLLGLLSLNLAIVNLLPIPGLDGGRIVFVLLEILRGGKKLDPAREGLMHLIGFLLLISLMLLFTYYDITGWLSGRPLPLFGP